MGWLADLYEKTFTSRASCCALFQGRYIQRSSHRDDRALLTSRASTCEVDLRAGNELRLALLVALIFAASGCGASDAPTSFAPADVIESAPAVAVPCQSNTDCDSGLCVPQLCPLTLPGTSFCGREIEPQQDGCATDETCVDVVTGKFAPACPPDDLQTTCVPLTVCADARVAGGVRCERDWECESGDCIGIVCDAPPGAFAFGALQVCSSSRCIEPVTETAAPLGECAARTSCSGPGAAFVTCVASACPEAYSDCEADPECRSVLTCATDCPQETFWSCLDSCIVREVPCAPGEEERRTPQADTCYCVPERSCD